MAASSVEKEIGDYLVDLDLDNILGKGTYGQVFLGAHVRTGRKVAVKLLQADKQFVTKDTDIEARAMMAIPDHENVLKIFDLIKKEVIKRRVYINFYLVLEYCPLGSVVDYAAENSISLIDKLELMLHGNLGIRHLHHIKPKCFVHRDIKPSNMLIAGDSNKVVLKIGDFGEVKIIEQSKIMESIRGTQSYWAPEMFSLSASNVNPSYNRSVDVFSKGMSDLALLDCGDKTRMKAKKLHDEELGLYLYRHKDETVPYSIEKKTDTDDVKQVKRLIKLMIAQKASDRPSIQEVVDTLSYLLTKLRAKILDDKPPALLDKLAPSGPPALPPRESRRGHVAEATEQPPPGSTRRHRAGTVFGGNPEPAPPTVKSPLGATAQPPQGSAREHLAAVSPGADKAEQLPVHELNHRLSGLDVRPATKDIVIAVNTFGGRGLWILANDEWEKHPIPAEIPKRGVCFAAVAGGIVAMGGTDLSNNSAKCFLFSLTTKQWTKLPDMITPRYGASAVEIRENVVAVVGGRDSKCNDSAACEILDIGRGEWIGVGSIAEPLFRLLLAVIDGRVYVLPRDTKKSLFKKKYNRKLHALNTVDKRITPKAPLTHSTDTESLGLVALGGKLYFFSVNKAGSDQGHCCQYDPLSDVWSVQETRYPLLYRWPWHCAAVVRDEKILFCGDFDCMVEYSASTNTWRILSTRLPFSFGWTHSYVGTAHVRE